MPTTATPLCWYSLPSLAISWRTCLTYGQWLHRKITSTAGAFLKSSSETSEPSVSASLNAGADVPSGSMVEGVSDIGWYLFPVLCGDEILVLRATGFSRSGPDRQGNIIRLAAAVRLSGTLRRARPAHPDRRGRRRRDPSCDVRDGIACTSRRAGHGPRGRPCDPWPGRPC